MSFKSNSEISFDAMCELLESMLASSARSEIVADVAKSTSFSRSLSKLREAMRSNDFRLGAWRLPVNELDARTRRDGFHALHDWDGNQDAINEDIIPVDVLAFMMDKEVPSGSERRVLAILLDYYFAYVIALMTLRVWDEGDANDNLDRLSGIVRHLQGPNGSGQHFAAGAEMLMLVAISHYESDESAYERLLDKIRILDRTHRESFALILAGIYGSHLRFGFEATYGRDIIALRKDNGPDYPWLLFALVTLVEAYDRGNRSARVVEGLVNGLSPDPRAFVGKAPDSLARYGEEHARFRALFDEHREGLLIAFEQHRPAAEAYSPVAFYFNFLHNTLKAVVVDALLRGEPWTVAVDELLTAFPEGGTAVASEALARTLMSYAQASPDKIRGQWVPVIVYDPRKGRRAFTETLRRLKL